MIQTKYKPKLPTDACTGCGSCVLKCPKGALSLGLVNGFYKTTVDLDCCIGCRKCETTCHVISPITFHESIGCKAVMASDEIRLVSSSGGAFSIIAEDFILGGGSICAAKYTLDYYVVHGIFSDSRELPKYRLSKYFQSNTLDIFGDVKKALDAGTRILFVGCPCQVSALKLFLKKDYNQLYTIDLICHGISSRLIFEEYIKSLFPKKQVISINFKNKMPWGWRSSMQITFDDGSKYIKITNEDLFLGHLVNTHYNMNSACFSCKYKRENRVGDLTIGDFWGIHKYDRTLSDELGVSVVLINTIKGKELFDRSSNNYKVVHDTPIQYAVAGNVPLRTGLKRPLGNNRLLAEYSYVDYKKLINSIVSNDYDIGLWVDLSCNYNQALSVFFLYLYLQKAGHTVCIICDWDDLSVFEGLNVYSSKGINYKNIHLIIASFNVSVQKCVNTLVNYKKQYGEVVLYQLRGIEHVHITKVKESILETLSQFSIAVNCEGEYGIRLNYYFDEHFIVNNIHTKKDNNLSLLYEDILSKKQTALDILNQLRIASLVTTNLKTIYKVCIKSDIDVKSPLSLDQLCSDVGCKTDLLELLNKLITNRQFDNNTCIKTGLPLDFYSVLSEHSNCDKDSVLKYCLAASNVGDYSSRALKNIFNGINDVEVLKKASRDNQIWIKEIVRIKNDWNY